MAKPRENRQKDLLRPALEDIIDLGHPLVRLTRQIDWGFLDGRFASVCTAGAGQPPLPTRLMAGLYTCTTCRMRRCARAGWRTRIISSSAVN
jgi:IS5 family transposase